MEEKSKEIKLAETAEKLGVDLILLFGSRADGSNRKDSDFDIAYRSSKVLENTDALFNIIEEYFGSDNLQIIDLNIVKPLFLYEIMNNCKVLYAKDMMEFYDLRCYALGRYYDEVKPLYQIKFDQLKTKYHDS